MALLNKELITVQPKRRNTSTGQTGHINDGASFDIWATVVPATTAMLQHLEEGVRKSTKWIVHTEGPVKPFEVLPAAPAATPVLTTSQGTLIPVGLLDFSNAQPGALLPNCSYACSEVAADEPSR